MEDCKAKIIDLLLNKAALKQDIADYAESVIRSFKEIAEKQIAFIGNEIDDTRIRLKVESKGKNEVLLYVGSDVIVFQLHSNVFRMEDDNPMWKTEYLKSNGANGFFGIINIYNFLAESYEQNRLNDEGYLIGRLFLNHDNHFLVEGKGQLETLFKDLESSEMNEDVIGHIIQQSILHAIEFDLITPPYEQSQQVTLMEVQAISTNLQLATGKRLGFKFRAEDKRVL